MLHCSENLQWISLFPNDVIIGIKSTAEEFIYINWAVEKPLNSLLLIPLFFHLAIIEIQINYPKNNNKFYKI